MLIKLLPEQIAKAWDEIRLTLVHTWRLDTAEQIQEVLKNLLSGSLQCWIGRDAGEMLLLILTRINICDVTGIRRLEIVTLYGFKPLTAEIWDACFSDIKAFAVANKCSFITATSDNPRVLQMAQRYNFKETKLLTLEV